MFKHDAAEILVGSNKLQLLSKITVTGAWTEVIRPDTQQYDVQGHILNWLSVGA